MSDRAPDPLFEAIRSALSRDSRIAAWQIRRTRSSGRQTYLVGTQLESMRGTESGRCEVAVFVRQGQLLGRSEITLAPGEERLVPGRIDQAVYMAGLGGDAPWTLPEPGEVPAVQIYDPALDGEKARETSRRLVEEWRSAVSGARGVKPSSMELFCRSDAIRFENSAGFAARTRATRVSLLTILLAADGPHAAERESWEERRRASDLDVAGIVRRAAEEARDLTRASLPPSGEYPVVIDAREIPSLLSPIQTHASAQSLYQKTSRFAVGEPLPIENPRAEPLTVVSNAIAPYGLESYAFDGDGVPGRRVEIVKDGFFAHPWATKQYADYLEAEPTGGFANWEVPPGKTALEALLSGEGPVLYVRAFSWLNPDRARGDFASEIRVGQLHGQGRSRPVKGGSVSGNLFRALGTARYASERVFLGDYLGTAAIRLEGVTVAGS